MKYHLFMNKDNQLELFDSIFKTLSFNNKKNKNKEILIFIFSLIWSYHKFRSKRPTRTEQKIFEESLKIQSVPLIESKTIHIFPACDIVHIKNKNIHESRFLEKVKKSLPSKVFEESHQIIRDYSNKFPNNENSKLTFIKKPYVKKVYLLQASFLSILDIFKNLWIIKSTNKFTSRKTYLAIFRSLILYNSNLIAFKKLFKQNKKISYVVVSNFYSPENLALINVANEFNIETYDIQHGVQRNVVAYERFDNIPSSLKPSKIVNWSDVIPESMNANESFTNFCSNLHSKKCLVTLQPSNSDNFLKSLNNILSLGIKVIVRPHPRRNGSLFLERLRDILDDEIIINSENSLKDEFINNDIHISEYSSSLIESAAIGLLSVAVHNTAKEYLCDEIKEGKILFFSSLEHFIDAIK